MTALVVVLGLGLLASTSLVSCGGPRDGEPSPHVILYLIDALRADHLGVYGYERRTSPVMDGLAAEAVLFENAYVQTSWTKPSVGSLFTGLFASRHGAIDRGQSLRGDVPTLAELFQANGYETVAFLTNPNVLPIFGFGRGFDHVFDIESRRLSARAEDVHEAIFEFLDSWSGKPLFVYVHTRDPHRPYDPPPEYRQLFKPRDGRARTPEQKALDFYDGEIHYSDEQLGLLLEDLTRRGILQRSLFVLLSDHGEEFLDHGGISHGKTLFEEVLRVPLVVRLPEGARAGARVKRPVRIMDLLPTVAGFAGLEAPQDIDARSFLPLLVGEDEESVPPPLMYAELNSSGHVITSLTVDGAKVIRRRLPEEQRGDQLFDLKDDPGELENLAEVRPDLADRLRQQLDDIELGLSAGVHVELRSSSEVEAVHRLRGSLETIGGTFDGVSSPVLEEKGQLRLSPDSRRVDFEVTLTNRPNPLNELPRILIDTARIHFDVPEGTRFRLEITEGDGDGVHVPVFLALGNDGYAAQPIEVDPADPTLAVGSLGMLQTVDQDLPSAHCRVFTVSRVKTREVTPDETVLDRLRALGYMDEE
jgi:arylsulfatase A-like enzyme